MCRKQIGGGDGSDGTKASAGSAPILDQIPHPASSNWFIAIIRVIHLKIEVAIAISDRWMTSYIAPLGARCHLSNPDTMRPTGPADRRES
jgi:hypothetical protein